MSQVHYLCANKYPQFTNRNLKPALQLSRSYQGQCHPGTLTGQDIWFPPIDSWASGSKHWDRNQQLMPPSDSSSERFWSGRLCRVVEREHCVSKASAGRHDDQLRAWFGDDSHFHGDWHSGMTDLCHQMNVYGDDVAAIRLRHTQHKHSELQCSWAWQNRRGHCSHRGTLFSSRWGPR